LSLGSVRLQSWTEISRSTGVSVRVGMEATGHARWFEQLLAELRFKFNYHIAKIDSPLRFSASRIPLHTD
jgi:hypothetical protein